jgi:protein NrfD
MRVKPLSVLLMGLWLVLAVFGTAGIIERLLYGHRLAAYTSYVPWGMWVAAYIYFIGLSAGAFLLSSLIYVFGVQRLERIGKLSLFVAVVTLIMALLTIWFDIGHMERFWEIYARPQFHSMMAWMVWLYTAYFVLLLGELYYAMRRDWVALSGARLARDDRILQVLGTVGVPLAIAFHGGVGALFGTVLARDLWHSPVYPLLFITGALISGGALIIFVVAYFWPVRDAAWRDLTQDLGRIVLGLVLLGVLLEWAEYSIPMWYGVGPEYTRLVYVLFGPYWYTYWGVHVLAGVLVPVLLLWRSRNPYAIGTAGGLVALTYFAERLNLVIPGLVFPELKGLESAYLSDRLSYAYFPSLFEWQVTAGVVALGIALFYLGYRYLPLVRTRTALKEVA